MRAEVVQNGDHRQMKFKSMDVRIKVGDYNVVLENLFGGDPILGKHFIKTQNVSMSTSFTFCFRESNERSH